MVQSQTTSSSSGMTKSDERLRYPRLPAQQSIRVFESTARHLSFTQAGLELSITQSGVSKQIKNLETFLGVLLFNRQGQNLLLTEDGKLFLRHCVQALDCLQVGVQELKGDSGVLRLQAPPSFVVRWLIPRMKLLRRDYPQLDLRIETTWDRTIRDKVQLQTSELVIHACYEYESSDLIVELLRQESLFVMVSPQYLQQEGSINTPFDLINKTLIHTKLDGHIHWEMWAKQFNINEIDTAQGYEFETMDMALSAAENGVGVVVCDLAYALESLRSGRLIIPFKSAPVKGINYYLLKQRRDVIPKLEKLYCAWLKDKIEVGELEMRRYLQETIGFE